MTTEPAVAGDPGSRTDESGAEDAAHRAQARAHGRHVTRGSIWYIAAIVTGAVLSLLSWALVTHVSSKSDVGVASAIWYQVLFVNYLTGMGLPIAVARYGSLRAPVFDSLFRWALLYTALTSLFGAVLFGIAAPSFVQPEYLDALYQWGQPVGILLFFLLTTGMSYALLVETRLVTMRRWGWVYGRVLVISLIRFPLLLVPAIVRNPIGLLLLILGPPALSGFIGVLGIRRGTPPRDRGPLLPLPEETFPALKYASVNYAGMLAAQAPQFVLPIIVARFVTANDFGPFSLAWQITIVVFLVPHVIGQVLVSEGGRDPVHLRHQVNVALRLSLGLMVVAALVASLGASLATIAFGESYALIAQLLPMLVGAAIPWAFTCMCLARARVEANHLRTVVITACFAACTLIPAAIMSARSGATGASAAWLLGNILAAFIALAVTRWVKPARKADLVGSPGA